MRRNEHLRLSLVNVRQVLRCHAAADIQHQQVCGRYLISLKHDDVAGLQVHCLFPCDERINLYFLLGDGCPLQLGLFDSGEPRHTSTLDGLLLLLVSLLRQLVVEDVPQSDELPAVSPNFPQEEPPKPQRDHEEDGAQNVHDNVHGLAFVDLEERLHPQYEAEPPLPDYAVPQQRTKVLEVFVPQKAEELRALILVRVVHLEVCQLALSVLNDRPRCVYCLFHSQDLIRIEHYRRRGINVHTDRDLRSGTLE